MEEIMKQTSKVKRISAIVAVALLLGLYVLTLLTAILAKPYANAMFMASILGTVIIPVFLYASSLIGRAFGKQEGTYTLKEMKRMQKEIEEKEEQEEPKEEES